MADKGKRPKAEKPKRPKLLGTVHHPPADDPRNIFHPSHKEQWDAFAEAIGRLLAREDYARAVKEQQEELARLAAEDGGEK